MKVYLYVLMLIVLASDVLSQIQIRVTTDNFDYEYGQDINIFVLAYNYTQTNVILKFGTLCQAQYIIDGNNSCVFCPAVYTERSIPPLSSYTWDFSYKASQNPLKPGFHQIIGEVIDYGYSEPIYIRIHPAPMNQMQITVATDTNTYSYDQGIKIFVTAYNSTIDTMRLEFPTSYQSTYYIDNLRPNPIVLPVFTGRIILPNQSYTWELYHTTSEFSIKPGFHRIIGEVIGYGQSSPIYIIVNPATGIMDEKITTNKFQLDQNYPNPFNPSTTIEFSLPSSSHVVLKIYDILGKEIFTLVDETLAAGQHQVNFNARQLTSGVYFYKIQAGEFTQMKKMVLMQ